MCGNDNISVLPDCLYNEYKTYIYNREYLEAGSLLVNINSKRLIWDKDKFYYDQDLKIHIASYDYQETRGLDFDKTSSASFI
jgi:CRISPR-associated endonuclease/helicase Cas3